MKRWLVSVFVVSFLLPLTGCTPKNPQTTSPTGGQKYEMQIWATEDVDLLDALGREFKTRLQDPNVKVKVVGFENEEELNEYLLDAMAGGWGPDIVYTSGDWVWTHKDKIIPIEDDESFPVENFRNTFVRVANETLIDDDEIYGVPITVDSLAIIYNEDHLASNLADRNAPASTWKGLQQDIQTLSRPDNSFERFSTSGAAIGRVDNVTRGFDIVENIIHQTGTPFFSEDGEQATFASARGVTPEGVRKNFAQDALEYYTAFADPKYEQYAWSAFVADPVSREKEWEAFLKGKVSMVFGTVRDYHHILSLQAKEKGIFSGTVPKENIRVAFLPQYQDPEKSSTRAVVGHVQALAVTRSSQYPALAWRFLKFAIRKENVTAFFEQTQVPTARLDLVAEQEGIEDIGIYVRQAKFAEANVFPLDRKKVQKELESLIQRVNDGKETVREGVKAREANVNAILNRKTKIKRQARETKGTPYDKYDLDGGDDD